MYQLARRSNRIYDQHQHDNIFHDPQGILDFKVKTRFPFQKYQITSSESESPPPKTRFQAKANELKPIAWPPVKKSQSPADHKIVMPSKKEVQIINPVMPEIKETPKRNFRLELSLLREIESSRLARSVGRSREATLYERSAQRNIDHSDILPDKRCWYKSLRKTDDKPMYDILTNFGTMVRSKDTSRDPYMMRF